MLGRSVMNGWFAHWTGDSGKPYRRDGFVLYRAEVESPPEIARSAEEQVAENKDKVKIVFFKLCFVDFVGGSREEAGENLSQNKGYVERVYRSVVEDQGLKLIVGNALPQAENNTDQHLVWNHRQYNAWLKEFAASHADSVYVFDQYSLLADRDGNLNAAYATDPDDSHPNDQGYTALDESFFALLKTVAR